MYSFKYHLPGTAPATLIAPTTGKPAVTLIEYDQETYDEKCLLSPAEAEEHRDNGRITWINIDGLGDVDLLKSLGHTFGLHPLALEDVLNVGQRPKLERYDHHYFVVLQMAYRDQDGELVFEQISIFIGRDYVLTFQEAGGDFFDPIRHRLRRTDGLARGFGSDYLAYAIIDSIIDHYFPILECIGDLIEDLETEVLDNPTQETVAKLHEYKRSLVHLRRGAWPQREIISALTRDDANLVREATKPFLRDCYDHSIQIIDIVENYRELMSSIMDIYLSSVSMRTNEIMRVLTVLSSIFLPLTFIAGVYGMNFDKEAGKWSMPELYQPWGYPACLAAFAMIGLGMVAFFRHKKWL